MENPKILGKLNPYTFITTDNVVMLKTRNHPKGELHLIDETDKVHNSKSYIDLQTKKHINHGLKISTKEISKYIIELTEEEKVEWFEKNLKKLIIN